MKFPNPRGFGLVGCLLVLSLVFNFLSEKTALGQDWPQAQGPNRDNKSSETGLLQEWPEGGPPQAWISKAVGLGYSGPAIVGDQIFIMGARDGKTELIALAASDGAEQWSLAINEKAFTFDGNAWGAGPRATPSVSDGHVYALEGDGQQDWPPSPPLQQLSIEDLGGEQPAGLAVGMAGKSHWSLSAEFKQGELVFDVACRLRGLDATLGSSYQIAEKAALTSTSNATTISIGDDQLTISDNAPGGEPSTIIETSQDSIRLRMEKLPQNSETVRWRYRVRLN